MLLKKVNKSIGQIRKFIKINRKRYKKTLLNLFEIKDSSTKLQGQYSLIIENLYGDIEGFSFSSDSNDEDDNEVVKFDANSLNYSVKSDLSSGKIQK